MNIFEKAMNTLLYSWGSDTPPEAIWAGNEFLEFYRKFLNVKGDLIEDDMNGDNDLIVNQLKIPLSITIMSSNACMAVPRGSIISILKEEGGQVEFIYQGMWFGLYHSSNFTKLIL